MLGAAAFLLAVGLGVGGGAAAFVALEGGPKACQDSFGRREGSGRAAGQPPWRSGADIPMTAAARVVSAILIDHTKLSV